MFEKLQKDGTVEKHFEQELAIFKVKYEKLFFKLYLKNWKK